MGFSVWVSLFGNIPYGRYDRHNRRKKGTARYAGMELYLNLDDEQFEHQPQR